MSIIRLIHISIDPARTRRPCRSRKRTGVRPVDDPAEEGLHLGKAPLRSREAHEFISIPEWDSKADIQLYKDSDAHQEIVRHTRGIKGAKAVAELYELVT